ncbi:MAG: hypothetical protein HY298_20770 [Verrucomicrobia bacterium]|nr:hypothetical protein [Verrucomicrobiota bacterium]
MDAVSFLEQHCDLAVQLEIVPALWKVVSLDGEIDAVFTDAEIVNFAQGERDLLAVNEPWSRWKREGAS